MTETELQDAFLRLATRFEKLEAEVKQIKQTVLPITEAVAKSAKIMEKVERTQKVVKERLAKQKSKEVQKINKQEIDRMIQEKIPVLAKRLREKFDPITEPLDLKIKAVRDNVVLRKEVDAFIYDHLYDDFAHQHFNKHIPAKIIKAAGLDKDQRFVRVEDSETGEWVKCLFTFIKRKE